MAGPARPRGAVRRARGRRLRDRRLRRLRRQPERHRQPRADRRLRRLLGRDPVASAAARATSSAPSTRGARRRGARGWAAGARGAARRRPLAYPAWLGRWPAALGILAFAWVELVYANERRPEAARDHGAGLRRHPARRHERLRRSSRGRAAPTRSASTSACSPGCRRCTGATAQLYLRPPLAGAPRSSRAGTVALLCTMIGTDELRRPLPGRAVEPTCRPTCSVLRGPRLQRRDALEMAFTVGLLFMVGVIAGVYWLGVFGHAHGRPRPHHRRAVAAASCTRSSRSRSPTSSRTTSRCSPTRARRWLLVSDPLGDGSDLFGTAGDDIDYNVISAPTAIWYVQVARARRSATSRGLIAGPRPRARDLPDAARRRPVRSTGCSP